jgi:hypothetical protein
MRRRKSDDDDGADDIVGMIRETYDQGTFA